jgi:hypothetical protein
MLFGENTNTIKSGSRISTVVACGRGWGFARNCRDTEIDPAQQERRACIDVSAIDGGSGHVSKVMGKTSQLGA